MRGLSAIEIEVLLPGPPGAGPYPNEVFEGLVARGCARWAVDDEGTFFETTAAGLLAIQLTRLAASTTE